MKIRRLTKMHSLIALYLSSMVPSGQGLGREGECMVHERKNVACNR